MKNIFLLLILLPYWTFGQSINNNLLSKKLDSLRQAYAISGMQVVLVNKDSIQFIENYGNRLMSEQQITNESMFNVSSITKNFTALGLMLLVDEGKTSLEDKLKDIAPEINFENPWAETHPIQVVHLLEHTTGWRDVFIAELTSDRSSMSILQQANDLPKSRRCNYPPGQYFSYQNTNYSVAGYLIEKISGMPYQEFIQQRILAPMNMEKSTLDPADPYLIEHLAINLDSSDAYRLVVDEPAGGLFTSAREMSGYLRMYLNRGLYDSTQIVQASTIERMYTPTSSLASKAGNKLGYGLGWYVEEWKGTRLLLHAGEQPYATSIVVVLPELDQAFFITANTNNSIYPLAIEIMKVIGGANLIEDSYSRASVKEEELLGMYRPINTTSNTRTIEFFMDYLFSPIELVSTDKGLGYKNYLSPQAQTLSVEKDYLYSFRNEQGFKNWLFSAINFEGELVLVDAATQLAYKKSSAFSVWGSFILFILCSLFILSVPIIVFFRLIWKYIFRKKLQFQFSLRLGFSAFLLLLIFNLMMVASGPESTTNIYDYWLAVDNWGSISLVSLLLFVSSLLFGLFSVGTLVYVLRNFKIINSTVLKIYTLGIGLALVITSAYLLNFGYIGFMPWNY
jgi:CubicO group peptidase (beta-lactamase class C family)